MSDDTVRPQWWTTLPGILTAMIGLIAVKAIDAANNDHNGEAAATPDQILQ